MSRHTPGPWVVVDDGTIRSPSATTMSDQMADYRGAIICDMKAGTGSEQWPAIGREHAQPEANANARLIAAAPDLLEALKALAACEHDPKYAREVILAGRAITKATTAEGIET